LLSVLRLLAFVFEIRVMKLQVREFDGKEDCKTRKWKPYLQLTSRLSTPTILARCQILPKQGMVDMSTTMEVNQRLESNLGRDILLRFGCLELFRGSVEAVNICLVVVLVV
jgi:hypothetical protein